MQLQKEKSDIVREIGQLGQAFGNITDDDETEGSEASSADSQVECGS